MAENGSSETTASDSGLAPFTRSSNRDRIRVSRTKRPSAEGVTTSPSRPLMAKVDSSTRVTTPPAWPRPATLPLKVHGSLTGADATGRRGQSNDLVGAFRGDDLRGPHRGPVAGPGIVTMAVVQISPRR